MNDKNISARLKQESAVVPRKVVIFAKFLAIMGSVIFACLLIASAAMFFSSLSEGRHLDMGHNGELIVGALAIAIGSLFVAGYIMLVGYVYGDARRRGMPPVLWTLLVVLIPNMIGFIVYFILRRGIFAPCPQCGRGAEVGQIYCSACGHKLEMKAS
ncbi:MAG TPA: zinc ribbon domain-containing protein [Terriglobales bacterium]|nr:zinc ribbon domain-containing protein [Terriglobales bacterium]